MGRPSKAELQARRRAEGSTAPAAPAARPRRTKAAAAEKTPEPRPATTVPNDPDGAPIFDPLLTIDQVALWLGKPKNTLYAWRVRGKGPRVVKIGGDLRYRRSDVEEFIESNIIEPLPN